MIELKGGTDERPPPRTQTKLKNSIRISKESFSTVISYSRDSWRTPDILFRNLHWSGSGTSRGCLIYSLYSDIHGRCTHNSNINN